MLAVFRCQTLQRGERGVNNKKRGFRKSFLFLIQTGYHEIANPFFIQTTNIKVAVVAFALQSKEDGSFGRNQPPTVD